MAQRSGSADLPSTQGVEVAGTQLADGVAQHLGGGWCARRHGQINRLAQHPVVALHLREADAHDRPIEDMDTHFHRAAAAEIRLGARQLQAAKVGVVFQNPDDPRTQDYVTGRFG